ncbi:hypothetical protein D3C78_1615370 [compost metagenome]
MVTEVGQQLLHADLAAVVDDQQGQQLRQATEHGGESRSQAAPPATGRARTERDDQPQREPQRYAGQRQGQGDQGAGHEGHAPAALAEGK